MKKLFKINFKTATLLILTIAIVQCTKKIPTDLQTFSSWFINPSEKFNNSLTSVTRETVNSLVKEIRKNSATGALAETLYDSANTAYVLGYKTPELIKPDSVYPLIIYLHGGTGTTVNTKGARAFEMLSPLADSMQLFLASPSASASARWWSPNGMSRILQTLRFMTLHYPIDSSKVFLAGVSDGATGCWAAANAIYAPFAGFFAISGYGGLLPMTGMELFPENLMQRPIYNVNAGNDRLYPLEIINRFLEYMANSGVQVISKIYPDQDHGFDYRDQEFGTLCNFIRTWSRPAYNSINFRFVPNFPNYPDNIFDWKLTNESKQMCNVVSKKDTLLISTKGVQSLIIRLPSSHSPRFARLNQMQAKKITFYHAENPEYLKLMKHSCFPGFSTDDLIKIKM
ncbi:MAG: hypothetical protein GX267_00075 [Fibrobacter sp.]|jgi:hypothetical protein|nr:hypothetical protein [Fibrobacter sp.]